MRRTTPSRETKEPPSQHRLNLVEPGEPTFERKTIARYRVALVREESVNVLHDDHWSAAVDLEAVDRGQVAM